MILFAKNKEKDNQITVSELVYLLYFGIMLGAKAIGLIEGQFYYNVVLVIGAGLFALKMIISKYSLVEYFFAFILLTLGMLVYLNSGEKSLLIFLTMMLGMKGVSEGRVFKTGMIIWLSAFLGMYVLSVVGVIPEIVYTLDRRDWPPILRHTLGYPHPNTLHITYYILCVFVLFTFKNLSRKKNVALAIILMLGNCYVFMYSLSRNGFIVTTVYLLLHIFLKYHNSLKQSEKIVFNLIFPFSALIMEVAPLVIKGNLFEIINVKLAGRFEYARYFISYEPLKLFGIREIPLPRDNYVIDSSYVYLAFRLGIVAFVLYFVAVIFLIKNLIKNERFSELAVVLALSVGGINETYLFNQSYKNLIFIFLGTFFYSEINKLTGRLPELLTSPKIGFDFGNRALVIGKEKKNYSQSIPVNIWVFTAFLLVLSGILTSILYIVLFKTPQDIYLPSYELTTGDGEEVYLTSDEVKALKKDGNIVRGYVDENTPLYRVLRRGTVKVEYIRYIFSYGLWGGSIVSIAFLIIWTTKSKVRMLLRNNKVGSEYKENVLIVHNYYRIPGGEDIVVANEKKLLEKNGHKVILYSRNNEEAGDSSFIKKIGLAFISIFNIRTYRDICSIIEKEKIDIVHVHNTVALISPAVYIAGINRGVPVVQTIHNFRLVCPNGVCYIQGHVCERCLEHGLKASLLYNCYRNSKLQTFVCALTMKLQRLILTYRSINYICLTEFNKQKIMSVKQIREENIFIKPNFTTMEAEFIPYSERKRQLIYAGRLEKIKGVDLLLQAWMKLGDKAPKLLICGSGELEEYCRDYIENNDITNVEMLGQISNVEVKKLVGESLAMVYPTQWYEGFPMAVAEAYTMGTPIIASDIGNVGDLVVEGISGLKFKSNSVVALAKTVENFMANPIEVPEEYREKYTAENNYKILKAIYESIRKRN